MYRNLDDVNLHAILSSKLCDHQIKKMIGVFYGLDYPYGSRTTAPYGDSVSKCPLVVGGSGAQPSGYPTEELSQSMSY